MPGPEQRKKAVSQADPELRNRPLAMQEADLAVRADLVREGVLWDTYHTRMEQVHLRNSAELAEIWLRRTGWR